MYMSKYGLIDVKLRKGNLTGVVSLFFYFILFFFLCVDWLCVVQECGTHFLQSVLDIAALFNIFCLAVLNVYFDTYVIHSWMSSCGNLIV